MADPKPRRPAGLRRAHATSRSDSMRRSLRGPWRVVVREHSMAPAIEPGDWLLVDPSVRRWPRRGSIVVFREPGTELIAIKRVAARPGEKVSELPVTDPATGEHRHVELQLGPGEAWLLGDAAEHS